MRRNYSLLRMTATKQTKIKSSMVGTRKVRKLFLISALISAFFKSFYFRIYETSQIVNVFSNMTPNSFVVRLRSCQSLSRKIAENTRSHGARSSTWAQLLRETMLLRGW